ncbi:hypothetical protein Tco_0563106, partial [Tanacetum coccineum]
TQKYINKGCELFLAQVTEQESKEKLVAVGSSGIVREEEGWIVPNVH